MSEKKGFGLTNPVNPRGDSFIENEDGTSGYDEMQPGGLCHYSGPEADIPVGLAWTNVPNWGPELAAVRWEVDAPLLANGEANPDGVLLKKTDELKLSDFIVGVELNKATLARHKSLIQDANAGPRRKPTYQELGLIAIRNMRQVLRGERTIINL